LRTQISRMGWLLSALWVCSAAQAQAPATPEPTPGAYHTATTPTEPRASLTQGEAKAMREFKMLDFNGDGKLSRTEVKLFPRLAAAFDEADTDGDGYVSYDEVRVFAAKYRAERERVKAAQATTIPPTPHTSTAASETRP